MQEMQRETLIKITQCWDRKWPVAGETWEERKCWSSGGITPEPIDKSSFGLRRPMQPIVTMEDGSKCKMNNPAPEVTTDLGFLSPELRRCGVRFLPSFHQELSKRRHPMPFSARAKVCWEGLSASFPLFCCFLLSPFSLKNSSPSPKDIALSWWVPWEQINRSTTVPWTLSRGRGGAGSS